MALTHLAEPTDPQAHPQGAAPEADGPEGNERLTALTGAVLLLLFAVQGITLLSMHTLLYWHFFIGLLLIGPVALKIGTTGHRVIRYYTGHLVYRRKGPPAPLLRALGPLVVATSVAVLATGVTLALVGRTVGPFPVLLLHKASFFCWAAVMTVHVLAHVRRLPRLIAADLRRGSARHGGRRLPGARARWALLAAALGVGFVLALLGAPLAAQW
ncbi:hypothetical protein AB0N14_30645 [Streptomyces sp. NPDC051104]|uniref:hypothetical protein n=1 Tax=Streptomyces sp. NPDC051104 TaxID=3155044 RepID=UPI003412B365